MRRGRGVAAILAVVVGGVGACRGGSHPSTKNDPASPTSATSSSVVEMSAGDPSASASASAIASASASTSASVAAAPEKPSVSTTRWLGWIYERPNLESPHIGYMRAGAHVVRAENPVEKPNGPCPGGQWWAVEPWGFVCEGHDGVTTDLNNPTVVAAATKPPDVTSPLPYGYGTSFGAPLYVRVPTKEEQERIEGDVAAKAKAVADEIAAVTKKDPAKQPPRTALPVEAIPDFLSHHEIAAPVVTWNIGSMAVEAGFAWHGMRLAFTRAFEVDGRPFYLTTEHYIVPADRFRAAKLAAFEGIHLAKPAEEGVHLPLVWVRWHPAHVYQFDGSSLVDTSIELPFQFHAQLLDKDLTWDGTRYHELASPPPGAEEGHRYLVRAEATTRVDPTPPDKCPKDLQPNEKWIEVRISQQTLILYEGTTPIFDTLVSTGVDGAGDPETTRSTPRGAWHIHSKHITYRMAGEEHEPWKEGDPPDPQYQIDDVPWVEYFTGGYALHAAFWHDAFGEPKSHGCINLSPRDAMWLFGQTEPKVPEGWHGVYGGKGGASVGTLLIVRG
jgi:hypothetical protein